MNIPLESELKIKPELMYLWKVKPSKREGYYRTFYLETER